MTRRSWESVRSSFVMAVVGKVFRGGIKIEHFEGGERLLTEDAEMETADAFGWLCTGETAQIEAVLAI